MTFNLMSINVGCILLMPLLIAGCWCLSAETIDRQGLLSPAIPQLPGRNMSNRIGKVHLPSSSDDAPAARASICPESYSPCTCEFYESYLEMYVTCINVPLLTVQAVLRRTTTLDITELYLTPSFILDLNIPADLLSGKGVHNIVFNCPSPSSVLTIDQNAFNSSRDFTELVSLNGCNISQVNYTFLTDFNVLSSLVIINSSDASNFESLPARSLPALTRLSVSDTNDFRSFAILPKLPFLTTLEVKNCRDFDSLQDVLSSLPSLTSLTINNCPKFRQWEIFSQLTTGLQYLSLNTNKFNDQGVKELLDTLIASPVVESLKTLSLSSNLLTQVPSNISLLPQLSSLQLGYNAIPLVSRNELNFSSPAVNSLYLSGNLLETIQPEAFQGNFANARIDLRYNSLTRFESTVFQPLLENMTTQGYVDIYINPIICDCHLSWLIRDNPQLLSRVEYGYCSNGTSFDYLKPDGYRECDGDGQLTTKQSVSSTTASVLQSVSSTTASVLQSVSSTTGSATLPNLNPALQILLAFSFLPFFIPK